MSLESIVAYKKDIFSASDAEARIKEIDMEVATLKSQLLASENASIETQEQRVALLSAIIGKMNENVKKLEHGELREDILTALRDIAYNLTIFEAVKQENVTRESLMRDLGSRIIREQFHRIANGARN